jgi:hypothetical protein
MYSKKRELQRILENVFLMPLLSSKDFRKPGAVIKCLSQNSRDILKNLKAEDIQHRL